MITVKDNFLPKDIFKDLQVHCAMKRFEIVYAGDKGFLTIPTPEHIAPYLEIPDHTIILSFIRKAHKDFDTDYRIHCDGIINNEQTALARVLYINQSDILNGTAFWEHYLHGCELPSDIPVEEFDRLLTEDANDLSKWEQVSFIKNEPNRCLTYNANTFHSKFPNYISSGERVVLVVFYKKN